MKTQIILLIFVAISTLQAQTNRVQLLHPLGGESITTGENFTVKWESDADSVTIKLVNIQTKVSTVIAESVAGSIGTYTWEAPSELPGGEMYLLKVEAKNHGSYSWTKGFVSVVGASYEQRAAPKDNSQRTAPYTNISANAAATATPTSTMSNTQTMKEESTLSGATEDDEFNNANMICEQTVCKIKTFRIGRLYPQPATNGTISIDAESNENATDVKAELYSITGQKIATLWEGNLKKGASSITITLNEVVSGSYIFYLKNNKGEVVDYNRLVIADGQK